MLDVNRIVTTRRFEDDIRFAIGTSSRITGWNGVDNGEQIYALGTVTGYDYASAFDEWTKVINISTPVANETSPNVAFHYADLAGNRSGYSWTLHSSSTVNYKADIFLDSTSGQSSTFQGKGTVVHEIGHILGLQHPDGIDAATPDFDRHESIMSYAYLSVPAVTPMIYDIAAAQNKYGANTIATAGASPYIATGQAKAWTIWDHSGKDTLDVSALNITSKIDLRGGLSDAGDVRFSTIGSEKIAIAWKFNGAVNNLACDIEVAKGSSASDIIIGGMAANELYGYGGADIIISGNKTDGVIFDDQKVDILNGGADLDTIDSIWGGEGDTWINDASSDKIYMNGMSAHITADTGNDTITVFSGDNYISFDGDSTPSDIKIYINPEGAHLSLSIYIETASPEIYIGNDRLIVDYFQLYSNYFADLGAGWEARVDPESPNLGWPAFRIIGPDQQEVAHIMPYLLDSNLFGSGLCFFDYIDPLSVPTWVTGNLATTTPPPMGGPQPTAGNDTLNGGAASEQINGLGGNDVISGAGGADTLTGGTGADSLTGGQGPDTFRYSSTSESQAASSAYDRITDFGAVDDSIDLRGLGFSSLVTASSTADSSQLRISYTASGDRTFIKNDQTGFTFALSGNHFNSTDFTQNVTTDNFIFTNATSRPGTGSGNVITGGTGRDYIQGLGGYDTLSGGAGFDTLEGGAAADTLTGGAGSDIFRFTQISESAGTIYDRITDFDATYDRIDIRGLGFTSITNATSTTANELRLAYNSGTDRTFVKNDQTGFTFSLNGNHVVHDASHPTGDIEQSTFIFL